MLDVQSDKVVDFKVVSVCEVKKSKRYGKETFYRNTKKHQGGKSECCRGFNWLRNIWERNKKIRSTISIHGMPARTSEKNCLYPQKRGAVKSWVNGFPWSIDWNLLVGCRNPEGEVVVNSKPCSKQTWFSNQQSVQKMPASCSHWRQPSKKVVHSRFSPTQWTAKNCLRHKVAQDSSSYRLCMHHSTRGVSLSLP